MGSHRPDVTGCAGANCGQRELDRPGPGRAADLRDAPRALGAGGVVEKDERVIAVDVLCEDREVIAQGGRKQRSGRDFRTFGW